MTNNEIKIFLCIIAFSGFISVVLGAFGAHALEQIISQKQLASYKVGVQYQMIHTLAALIILSIGLHLDTHSFKIVIWCFLIGILLFSGSIYLLSCKDFIGLSGSSGILGPITPIGGLFFIIGWAILAYKSLNLFS